MSLPPALSPAPYRFATRVLYNADKGLQGALNENGKYPRGSSVSNERIRLMASQGFEAHTGENGALEAYGSLPVELVANIVLQHLSSFRCWAERTGIVRTKDVVPVSTDLLNTTAADILKNKLKIPRNYSMSPEEQLWDHIFRKAVMHAEDSDIQEILDYASQISPESMEQTPMRLLSFRVMKATTSFFNHPIVKCVLYLALWWYGKRIFKGVVSALHVGVVPIMAHKAMVHLPKKVVSFGNQAVGLTLRSWREFEKHFLMIWLLLLLLEVSVGHGNPIVKLPRKALGEVRNIVQAPVDWVFRRVLDYSSAMYGPTLDKVAEIAQEGEGRSIQLGVVLAHRVWMDMLRQAKAQKPILFPLQAASD